MQNKFSKFFIIIVLAIIAASPSLVYAQPATPATVTKPPAQPAPELPVYNAGVDQSISDYLCAPSEEADGTDLIRCINRLYKFGVSAGALLLIFFIIYSGYIYITGGESGKEKAKSYISNTLIGMSLLLGSYVLLYFINPQLVVIKRIQPPIFDAEDLPSCSELGLGLNCTIFEGQDVAGNESSIPTPGSERDGVTYGGSTFNNFPRFGQCDSPWGPKQYGSGSAGSYCRAGCGPSSFAAIVKYYAQKGGTNGGTDVNPEVIGQLAIRGGYRGSSGGTNGGFVAAIAPKYGLEAKSVSWTQAVTYLEQGIPVHISSNWKGGGFKTNVSGGHYIVLIAKKGDTIYVADSWKTNITAVKADKMKLYYNRGFAIISPKYKPPAP